MNMNTQNITLEDDLSLHSSRTSPTNHLQSFGTQGEPGDIQERSSLNTFNPVHCQPSGDAASVQPFSKPPEVEEWSRRQDENGKLFYYNFRTKEKRDDKPQILFDWEDLQLRQSSEVGKFYNIIKELGRGSLGIVYKVQQRFDSQFYALKVVQEEDLREAQIMARLDHSCHCNIVKYYFTMQFSLQGSRYIFIQMELCTSTLNHYFDNKIISKDNLYKTSLGITRGLIYLHQNGLTHGDLKIDNILVREDPNEGVVAKIADFGNSCLEDGETEEAILRRSSNKTLDVKSLGLLFLELWYRQSKDNVTTEDVDKMLEEFRKRPKIPPEIKDRKVAQIILKLLLLGCQSEDNINLEEVVKQLEECEKYECEGPNEASGGGGQHPQLEDQVRRGHLAKVETNPTGHDDIQEVIKKFEETLELQADTLKLQQQQYTKMEKNLAVEERREQKMKFLKQKENIEQQKENIRNKSAK